VSPSGLAGAPTVAVVGGGISGLAAAHRLRTRLGPGARIVLVERAERLGGVLRTVQLAGVPMDVGAEAYLARRPEVPALAAELGLGDYLVHPGPATATVRAGRRTAALPAGTVLGVPGSAARLDGLLSSAAVARVRAEREQSLSWDGADRAVGALLRERFGDELTERLVDPLLSGVYAGRVDGLGLRATMPALAAALDAGAGSLTAAADTLLPPPPRESGLSAPRVGRPGTPAPVFGAVRGGYRVLLDALIDAAGVEVRLGLPVRGVTRRPDGWRLEIGPATAPEALDVDAVLLAVPAPSLRRLLEALSPDGARAAGAVELASPVVVALAYRGADAAALPATSGVLVAPGEPLHAKAFTHTARKWPHLAPEATDGLVRLRASLGRAGADLETAAALRVPDEELVARVRADLTVLTGITATPVATHVQRWGGGLPQYGVGHGELVGELETAVSRLPGVAVAGALLHGVGVPACVATARAAADRVAEHLAHRTGVPDGSMAV
jgi:oxygen-dependent protoporphyrinogen oxidase